MFPTTTAHTFIPRADLPMNVNGEEINIKKLYEKFRGTNSHGLVAAQFLGALNMFFGGDPEITRKYLTEFYQNMTVSNLSTDKSFYFHALMDISAEINIMLRRLVDQKNERIKKEHDDTDLKIETKYEIDDLPSPPETITIEEDDLNNEPESVDEKSKRIGDVIENTLETATQIEISDADRKKEQEWLDNFLRGIAPPTEQKLNDKAIAQVLSEETDNPQMDGN